MPERSGNTDELDQFDLAILDLLQKDNWVPQRTIGEQVHLSAAAVQRRIQRMIKNKVIHGNVAIVDPAKVGQPITLIVEVEVESERIDLIDASRKKFTEAPEVQQCYYVTGEMDFVLVVTIPSMTEYEAFTRRMFFANHNIKRFRTMVVMDRVKVGLSLSIASGRT